MRVLFAAAGTAGHVNPAIAMAELIRTRHPNAAFRFLVTPNGMEESLISAAGYETDTVEICGLKRKLTWENCKALHLLVQAQRRIAEIIRVWHPDLIIGTGGYMSLPAVLAGHHSGIPCVLHESNATAGLSVRLMATRASIVLGGFPTLSKHLPKKCHFRFVGTPVRQSFKRVTRPAARRALGIRDGEFLLLSVGGSLGAEKLNRTVMQSFQEILQGRDRLCMLLSTGKRFYSEAEANQSTLALPAERLTLVPYIEDMATALAAADLVISRGGAATIAELSVVGTPSVIIPYPAATGDHQTKNARALEALGGCIVITEESLTPTKLASTIIRLLHAPEQLRAMRRAAVQLCPRGQEDLITGLLEEVAYR